MEGVVGNRSPVASPLMDAIADWVGDADPGAEAVPTVLPAFTDSRWWRDAFPDCVAYGFFPQRHQTLYESWPLIHGADERIDVRDLGFATEFFADLPRRLLDVTPERTSSASAGWPCATACSSTAPRTGPPPCAPATGEHQGRLRPQAAAARRRRLPGVRGVARLGRGDGGDPARQARPARGRLPFQHPSVLAVAAGATLGGTILRRRLNGAVGEVAAALVSIVPALFTLRAGEVAAYHGVEHKAIAAYEEDADDAADATKEHERCGSHLVAPMLASNLAGTLAAPRAPRASRARSRAAPSPSPPRRSPSRSSRGASATPRRAPRALLRRPGFAIQRLVGTREPDERQLEVGRAALDEILPRRIELGSRPQAERPLLGHTRLHAEHGSDRVVPGGRAGSSRGPRSSSWACWCSSSGGR